MRNRFLPGNPRRLAESYGNKDIEKDEDFPVSEELSKNDDVDDEDDDVPEDVTLEEVPKNDKVYDDVDVSEVVEVEDVPKNDDVNDDVVEVEEVPNNDDLDDDDDVGDDVNLDESGLDTEKKIDVLGGRQDSHEKYNDVDSVDGIDFGSDHDVNPSPQRPFSLSARKNIVKLEGSSSSSQRGFSRRRRQRSIPQRRVSTVQKISACNVEMDSSVRSKSPMLSPSISNDSHYSSGIRLQNVEQSEAEPAKLGAMKCSGMVHSERRVQPSREIGKRSPSPSSSRMSVGSSEDRVMPEVQGQSKSGNAKAPSSTRVTGSIHRTGNGSMDISEMLASQRTELLELGRMEPMFFRVSSRKNTRNPAGCDDASSPTQGIVAEWNEYIENLLLRSPDFFSSDEALMKSRAASGQGRTAYSSLRLTTHNCFDVQHATTFMFAGKLLEGPTSSYKMFLAVVGQYMRYNVVRGYCELEKVCQKGVVYRSILDQVALEVFLNYFRLRGSVSGVQTKALQLGKLCSLARQFFDAEDDPSSSGIAALNQLYVSSVASGSKKLYRRICSARRGGSYRLAQGKLLRSEDFRDMILLATKSLKGILESFSNWESENRGKGEENGLATANAVKRLCVDSPMLLSKWCINLLSLVMLQAGGQRPQVFWQLQIPTMEEMMDFENLAEGKRYLSLRTVVEKRQRDPNFPDVILPPLIFPFLKFHRNFILPHLLKLQKESLSKDSAVESNSNSTVASAGRSKLFNALFLDTRTGRAHTTATITKTFKRFVENFDPELQNISSMTLRSCYATMMYKGYKDGEIFKDLQEVAFLDFLAKVMNTSSEQLRNTYIALERSHFSREAREVVSSFQVLLQHDDDERSRDLPLPKSHPSFNFNKTSAGGNSDDGSGEPKVQSLADLFDFAQ